MFTTICTVGFFLYLFLEFNYFLRLLSTWMFAQFFRRRISFLETSTIFGIVLPTDGDFMATHMNNARHLRECDFARIDYAIRSGISGPMIKKGGNFPLAATNFRYRKPLYMFSLYRVETRPVWWDSKALYFEQRIITLSDNIIRSIGYLKVGTATADLEEIISTVHPDVEKPEMPEDLKKWVEYNEMHSAKLKSNL